MISDNKAERYVQIVLFYCLVLFVGMFSIYFFQCRIHMNMRELAQHAAAEISETGTISNSEQYLTCSVLYQTETGTQTLHQYYGQQNFPFQKYTDLYSQYYDKQRSVYALPFSAQPFAIVVVAGTPVFRDGLFLGEVYLTQALDYIPFVLTSYALVCTLLYSIVIYSVLAQRKSREKIETIYHQYIANISHELKTPIASIQAITETLSEGLVHDEATLSRYYGIISRESRLLEHSVLQIIELSKLQDSRITFHKTDISPSEIFDTIKTRYASRCEDLGLSFSIEKSIWNLPKLYTDPDRVVQLLEILLDNALKFVEEGGSIVLNATTKYGQATIRVNDTGRGISDDDLPHIFERFYKSEIDNPTGSGLGLAIAKEIINGLHETIWVQTEVGKGTTFFFTVRTIPT